MQLWAFQQLCEKWIPQAAILEAWAWCVSKWELLAVDMWDMVPSLTDEALTTLLCLWGRAVLGVRVRYGDRKERLVALRGSETPRLEFWDWTQKGGECSHWGWGPRPRWPSSYWPGPNHPEQLVLERTGLAGGAVWGSRSRQSQGCNPDLQPLFDPGQLLTWFLNLYFIPCSQRSQWRCTVSWLVWLLHGWIVSPCPKFIYWSSNSQCDYNWRQGL